MMGRNSDCTRIVLALGVLGAFSGPAHAGDATRYLGDARASVRLISGAVAETAGKRIYRAGLDVKLGPNWKTYWRYPGDSGVPPQFDFTGSENLAKATVLWPAPHSFEEGGSRSIGYKQRVIFPLHVEPRNPAKPVRLRTKFNYAVCEKICIPAEAELDLTLEGGASAHDADLRRSESRVARKSVVADKGSLAIRAIRRSAGSLDTIHVDIATPEGAQIELFAEGPTADWALPIPSLEKSHGGLKTFGFVLDGLPPGASPSGAVLRLTAVTEQDAIEVEARLD